MFQIHVQITQLSYEDVLQYVYFATIDTNGTQLLTGIVSRMCLKPEIAERHIKDNGIYLTLCLGAETIARKRGTTSMFTTASNNNRHQPSGPPMRCNCNWKGDCRREPTCKINLEMNRIHKCIEDLWDSLGQKSKRRHNRKRTPFQPHSSTTNANNDKNDWNTTVLKYNSCTYSETTDNVDIICEGFMRNVMKGRKGIGHVSACSLFQVLSLLGLIPAQYVQWSSIASPCSGGYKYINEYIRLQYGDKSPKITPIGCQHMMWDAKNVIESVYNGKIVPLSLLENMLCEMNRENSTLSRNGESFKNDVYYYLEDTRAHPQNWFKLSHYSNTKVILEMATGNYDSEFRSKGRDCRTSNNEIACYRKFASKLAASSTSHCLCWKNREDKMIPFGDSLPSKHAMLYIDESIAKDYKTKATNN